MSINKPRPEAVGLHDGGWWQSHMCNMSANVEH